MKLRTTYILLSSAALSMPLATAHAQDAAAEKAGEIVVTANKRTEKLKDVGLSVAAFSGTQLADRRVTSLQDVASLVPGLSFAQSATSTPIFTLRGVGFNERSLGVYPAVSVYIDQAPLPFPVMAAHSAFDLERIEVLKGPQGTLFGQNSTGGAINYIAAKPTRTFQAGSEISYGRFNQLQGDAYVSGPLTDTLAGRIAVTGQHMDDWQYSTTRRDTNGHQSYIAGRLLLDWQPTQTMKLSLNINGYRDTSQPQALQLVASRAQVQSAVHPEFQALTFSPSNPRAADWTNQRLDPGLGVVDPVTGATTPGTAQLNDFAPYGNRRFFQVALRGDIDVTDDITLTSLTSYDEFRMNQGSDGDGTYLVLTDLQNERGRLKTFNQEIRLANNPRNSFRWILGANYENSRTSEDETLRYFDNSNYNAANLYINASGVLSTQRIRNYAFFANVEDSVTDKLTLKGAVRYTNSRNHNENCGYTTPTGNVDKLFNFFPTDAFTQAIYGANFQGDPNLPNYTANPFTGGEPGVFTPIAPSGCYTLNELGVPGQPFQKTLKENNVSWRAGVDYKVVPGTLLYANVSRGYKAGSFPEISAANYTGLQPVTQESVTAYEAGLKTALGHGLLDIDAAAFYYDYRNKQIRGKLLDPVFGVLDALVNVPKSRIYGAEANMTLRPVTGLSINGAITYLNSRVLRYSGPNLLGFANDFHGDPLPFTPRWSGVVNVDYRQPVTSGGSMFFGTTINTKSSSDATLGAHRIAFPTDEAATHVKAGVLYPYAIDGYATVDGRLGYEAEDGAWKVTIWGKNIFNKYYWTNVVAGNDTAARFAGMPATYGISFGFKMR